MPSVRRTTATQFIAGGEIAQEHSRNIRDSSGRAGVESARVTYEGELPTDSPGTVTKLLRAWTDGDEGALERLTPLVEGELRRLARGYMGRKRRDITLQPTALVNEAFIRLTDARQIRWQDLRESKGQKP